MAGIRPSRVWAFTAYEVKRALARRKVLAMVAIISLLNIAGYFILGSSATSFIPVQLYPYLWVAGALALFSFFIQFLAILIAAGAMSEEYEAGTAEMLLAKPVSRTEFFLGKFLGGYVLLTALIILNALLSTVLATLTFGPQTELATLPVIILVEVYSSALFFSVAFMLGELVRRSSLAYIISSGLIVASQVVGTFLSVAYEFSGNTLYSTIHTYLPTTIAGSLPTQYEEAFLPSVSGRIFALILGPAQGVPSETTAALLVGGVLLVAGSVALGYFRWADVSRRVS